MLALLLAFQVVMPLAIPAVSAVAYRIDAPLSPEESIDTPRDEMTEAIEADISEISIPSVMDSPAFPEMRQAEISAHACTFIHTHTDGTAVLENTTPADDPYISVEPAEPNQTLESPATVDASSPTHTDDSDPANPIFSGGLARLTQESIAQSLEPMLNLSARSGTRIYYPYPTGAMAVTLYKDGRQVLAGQVADIGGTVYVPVQRFADLFGSFKTTYMQATEEVTITGTNLSIHVKVGDPYITVNERIFYTGNSAKVISLGGWIFVPLTSMCKAVNADVTIRSGYYDAFITSGDPTAVPWASSYYNATDLYWLSRIISAEARGEPFLGQIAVGNVVLNRVRSSEFPNTVKGVIFDTKYGTQFSPVSNGAIYNTPTESAVMAAKICLEGYSLSTRMIYFFNPSISTSSWISRTRPYIMTIGHHKFYA